MSTVNSKDSTESQQVRETYKKREQELKKLHKKELARVSEAHANQVQSLKDGEGKRNSEVQKNTQSTIERRDMRHQREIQKMKAVQSEQLKNLREARNNDTRRIQNSHATELEHQKDISTNRLLNNQMKSSQVIERERDQSANSIEQYRDRSYNEIKESRRKTQETHEADKSYQEKRHRSEKAEIIREKDQYKANKENEIETLKRKHNYQMGRLRDQQKINLGEKERVHQEVYKDMRDEHHYGIRQNQEKYNEALGEERKEVVKARESIYGQGGRIARERDKLNSQIRELKDKNVRDRTRADRQKRRELDNRVRADYKVIDTLFEERQGMVKEYNKINHEEITLANQRADDRILANYEYNKRKVEELDNKNNAEMEKIRHETSKENTKKLKENDLRFTNLKDSYVEENRRQKIAHKNAVERMKNHHYNTLDNERFLNSEQREKLVERFNQKMAEIDLKHKKELAVLKKEQNQKITELQSRHQEQVIDIEKKNKRTEIEKDRATQFQAANKKAQYDYRLRKIEGAHSEDMKRLNAQYRENLRGLIRDNNGSKVS